MTTRDCHVNKTVMCVSRWWHRGAGTATTPAVFAQRWRLVGRVRDSAIICRRCLLKSTRYVDPAFPNERRVTSSPRSRPSLWKGKENSHRATTARKKSARGEKVGREAAAKKPDVTVGHWGGSPAKKKDPKCLFRKVSFFLSLRACVLSVLVAATHVN